VELKPAEVVAIKAGGKSVKELTGNDNAIYHERCNLSIIIL